MRHRHLILVIALGLGLFTRAYQFKERFYYAHDNDLASWIVKDIIIDHHPRLIGQLTTTPGIFVGPLFYYSLIPFYLIGHMSPLYTTAYSWLIGAISIFSVYFVFSKLYGSSMGNGGSLLYAVSFAISQNEREVVPTTPVMLWSIWFFYGINLLFKGDKRSLLLLALLGGLVWHVHLTLALLTPLVVIGIIFQRKNFKLSDFYKPILIFIILSTPLLLFEVKHGFQQTNSLFGSLSGQTARVIGTRQDKLFRALYVASENATSIFIDRPPQLSIYFVPILLLILASIAIITKKLSITQAFILFVWFVLYIGVFTLHPINLSEYYLNGLNILWIFLATLILVRFSRPFGFTVLSLLVLYNLARFITSPVNGNNYVQKSKLVDFILADSVAHNYPCVSISYITNPGYEFGYRYLFYHAGLHVNQPSSNSPVYTIVFPHPLVNHLDKTFGALGLILPDYQKYHPQEVNFSCQGTDANLTDPMFGFTK